MNAVVPVWKVNLRVARQRTNRIETELDEKQAEFEKRRGRVAAATQRAEEAAILLMQSTDDLARTVARRHA